MNFESPFPLQKGSEEGESLIGFSFHGGALRAFHRDHPVVRFLFGINGMRKVVSIQQPNHGKTEKREDLINTSNAMQVVRDEVLRHLNSFKGETPPKVVFIGYSVGGMFSMKIFTQFIVENLIQKDSLIILIGCSFSAKTNYRQMLGFWTPEDFEARESQGSMTKFHGEEWRTTVISVRTWLLEGGPLYLTAEECEIFLRQKVYFILGMDGEVFDLQDILFRMNKDQAAKIVFTIPCDHFSYFSPQKWSLVQTLLHAIILMNDLTFTSTSKL